MLVPVSGNTVSAAVTVADHGVNSDIYSGGSVRITNGCKKPGIQPIQQQSRARRKSSGLLGQLNEPEEVEGKKAVRTTFISLGLNKYKSINLQIVINY